MVSRQEHLSNKLWEPAPITAAAAAAAADQKKPATKTFHSRLHTHTHAGNPTKPRHKNDDKQCEAFRDSWSQYIYLQMVAEISREGGFYYTTLLIHVCALNPDIIQKLSLRESWQRNCRSPPPPNPCEKLAEIYSTICRSADFWRETGRRSTICRSADLLREPDGDLR